MDDLKVVMEYMPVYSAPNTITSVRSGNVRRFNNKKGSARGAGGAVNDMPDPAPMPDEEMVDIDGERKKLTHVINSQHENVKYLPGTTLPCRRKHGGN